MTKDNLSLRPTWTNMKQRCLNPNNTHYKYYGARGIKVCDRWLESYQNFFDDMGERPEGMTLDRIDVNGNYEPSNCRWADRQTQQRNIRFYSKTNKSGHKGVIWHKPRSCWRSYVSVNDEMIWLGYFKDLGEAIEAREKGELEYYGQNYAN